MLYLIKLTYYITLKIINFITLYIQTKLAILSSSLKGQQLSQQLISLHLQKSNIILIQTLLMSTQLQKKTIQTFIIILSIFTIISFSQICTQSQYFNGQRCSPCKPNCACTSDNTCDRCLSGYAFDATFSNCLQCPIASNSVDVGCKQCCSQIRGTSFVCSQCPIGAYVYMKGGQCFNVVGCTVLQNSGICTSCADQFYLYQGICVACHSSCQTCKDNTLCLTCAQGYFNTTNTNFALCTACPVSCKTCTALATCQTCNDGYYLSGTNCIACGANCITCTASGCTICNPQSTLIAAVCYLCTDTTKSGTAGCQTCITNINLIQCTKCANTFYLNSNNGQCFTCVSSFANSLYCTSSGPMQCLNDYSATLTSRNHLMSNQCISNFNSCKKMLSSAGDCSECYFQGPDNYYKLSNSQCIKCQQLGCQTYSTSCQCLQCQQGYRYVNNLCVVCQNLHCIKCQSDVQSCQKCTIGYGLFSSACIACIKSNCVNCDSDYTQCKICSNGYYLNNGNCYLCQANCLLCDSNTKCSKCANGYYLQSNGRCQILPSNCLEVDSRYLSNNVAVCKKCEYGYQVMLGNCYPCSKNLFNLNTCQKYCPSYYALRAFEKYLIVGLFSIFSIIFAFI